MNIDQNKRSFFPWSYWIWLVHTFFVGSLYWYFYTPFKPDWFKMIFPTISLGHEGNYAVWWSGICLFIASQIFYRAASVSNSLKQSWMWCVLSIALLALGFDEIGSLHEMVSYIGGWQALLPFALIFIIGFGTAIFSLYRQKGFRLAATLIVLGLGLFAAVASLEFVEHNIKLNSHQQRNRLIVEEGAELFAMSLIIIAGLLSLRQLDVSNRTLTGIISPPVLQSHPHAVFFLFVIQFLLISLFAIPYSGNFSEGSPAAVFPLFLFYTLFLSSLRVASKKELSAVQTIVWYVIAIVFLISSISQIQTFINVLHRLEYFVQPLTIPPDTWAIMIAPLILLGAVLFSMKQLSAKVILVDSAVLLAAVVILYPDRDIPMAYYLFSGGVAYLCYRWMDLSGISKMTTSH